MSDEFGLQEGILYAMKNSRAKQVTQFGRMKTNHPIHPRATIPKVVKEAHLGSMMKRKMEVVPMTSLLQRQSRRLRVISSKSPPCCYFLV